MAHKSRFGAPIVMVSDSERPRVLQIATVTGAEACALYTSTGLRYAGQVPVGSTLALRVAMPGVHWATWHVWPDAQWLPEATTYFLEQLCDQGLCNREAARTLLQSHHLWQNPFAVCEWKTPRNGVDCSVGGLRVLLSGAASPPVCELLLRDGSPAFALPMPRGGIAKLSA